MSTWVLLLRTQEFQPTTPYHQHRLCLPSTLTGAKGPGIAAHLHWGWVCILLACVMVPSSRSDTQVMPSSLHHCAASGHYSKSGRMVREFSPTKVAEVPSP